MERESTAAEGGVGGVRCCGNYGFGMKRRMRIGKILTSFPSNLLDSGEGKFDVIKKLLREVVERVKEGGGVSCIG